ncbi:MAG: DUF5915 domain-containing protein, partial [Mycetocola sp.]
KGLTGGRSVHLTDWPEQSEFPEDAALVEAMDRVRAITGVVQALRKRAGRRVRQPLSLVTVVAANAAALEPFADILRDELNVKQISFVEFDEGASERHGITQRLTVNARAAGPRLGKTVQQAIKAAKTGDWSEQDGVVVAGGLALEPGEYELVLETSADAAADRETGLLAGGGFVLLDTALTPELEAEGLARDLIRSVQDARKRAGFEMSDRITLRVLFTNEDDAQAVRDAASVVDVAAETLALSETEERGYSVLSPSTGLAELPADADVSEWLVTADSEASEFDQDVAAGQYANRGRFIVRVSRRERSTDV